MHENEAEFHSLYVLLHLGSYSQPMVNLYIIGVINYVSVFMLILALLQLKLLNVAIFNAQGEPLSLWFRRVSTPVLKSKEMCFARRILR